MAESYSAIWPGDKPDLDPGRLSVDDYNDGGQGEEKHGFSNFL